MSSKKASPSLVIELDEDVADTSIPDENATLSFDNAIEMVSIDEELTIPMEDDGLEVLEASLPGNPAPSTGMSLSSIESFITEVDDAVEYLTMLIYGKNGTGKTTILSTVEGMLILAFEDGTLSIKDKAKGKAVKIQMDTWEKVEAVYWLLVNAVKNKDVSYNADHKINGVYINTANGKFLVKSLGFDTVTKSADVCMRNIVLGDLDKDPTKDVLKKTLKNWGDMNEKLKYWLQMFKELPLQKVWLLQETSNAEDIDSDEFSIYPDVNKGMRTYLMREADVIARTYIAKTPKGVQFRLSAAPNDKYVTKDRTNKIGVIANPSLSGIYKLVFGKDI